MYQGNWKCSSCGGAITELPFQPRSENGLTCKACFIKQKNGEPPVAPEVDVAATSSAEQTDAPPFDPMAVIGGEQAPPPPEFESAALASEKPKFTGDWKCSICGGTITSLPFEPRSTEGLKCIECFKQSKG